VAAKMFFDGRHALIVLGIRVALSMLLAILAALVLIVAVIALFIQLLWLAEIRLHRFEGQAAQYHQLLCRPLYLCAGGNLCAKPQRSVIWALHKKGHLHIYSAACTKIVTAL
jgi:hypothetical protein